MEKTNIYDILRQIQEELKVPKSRYNKFGDFTYRSCEDILEAIKPLLSKYGAAILLSDEIINIGDRYYIKATAQLSNAEGSLSTTGFARESFEIKKMHDAQIGRAHV